MTRCSPSTQRASLEREVRELEREREAMGLVEMEEKTTSKKKKDDVPPASVSLRRFHEGDAEVLSRWAGDEVVLRYFDAFEDVPPGDVPAARRYISEELLPHPCFMAVVLSPDDDDDPVGAVSVTTGECARDLYRAELGYLVSAEHRGRGVATAAVGAAVGYVFRRWPHLERLDAVVQVENAPSQRVLEKNGFTREGLLRRYVYTRGLSRDVFMYSFLRDDLLTPP